MVEFFIWLRKVVQLGTSPDMTIAKLLLGMVLYVVMPFDLIPDFIPIIGELDDAVVVILLISLAGFIYWRSRHPKEVLRDLPRTIDKG